MYIYVNYNLYIWMFIYEHLYSNRWPLVNLHNSYIVISFAIFSIFLYYHTFIFVGGVSELVRFLPFGLVLPQAPWWWLQACPIVVCQLRLPTSVLCTLQNNLGVNWCIPESERKVGLGTHIFKEAPTCIKSWKITPVIAPALASRRSRRRLSV